MIAESDGAEGQVYDELAHGKPFAEDLTIAKVMPKPSLEKEVATIGASMKKRHRKRGKEETEANAPPKVLRNDHAAFRLAQGTLDGESPVPVGLDTGSIVFMTATQDIFWESERQDPDWKCCDHRGLKPVFRRESGVKEIILLSLYGRVARGYLPAEVGRNQQLPPRYPRGMPRLGRPHSTATVAVGSQLRLRFEQEVRLLKKATAKIAIRDQKIQARGRRLRGWTKKLNPSGSVEVNSSGLHNQTKNLETMLEAEVSDLQAQVTSEEKIKAVFEEFKDMNMTRLNSVHGLRLAVMKCAESLELRQSFIDVVSAGLAKGMSEGLKHGIEHGRVDRDLADIESFNPEADSKYVKALYDLKDLKYPLVDQLEKLKDALIDVIMASLYLEKVRDPQDPWSFKEEIPLEDAIAANISRAKKKKKCWIVCRTHGVGFTYHARSDGVSVSVPTIAPQGLHIVLADAVTQTEISKDEASSRVLRSMSLPPMYSLDWS
uniref:Transposase (Putative), gypsy type n=1 Tax=Tanacetum cinerariifolium TaxID=118510 RepID=A0A6L2K7Y0_TANCI|nr:hypothetical protein [Tanacetum cinerariifolium]